MITLPDDLIKKLLLDFKEQAEDRVDNTILDLAKNWTYMTKHEFNERIKKLENEFDNFVSTRHTIDNQLN